MEAPGSVLYCFAELYKRAGIRPYLKKRQNIFLYLSPYLSFYLLNVFVAYLSFIHTFIQQILRLYCVPVGPSLSLLPVTESRP